MEILNCTWKFKVQCPKMWSGLRETNDPNVRLCESCLREVHLCENDQQVQQHAAAGHCVALQMLPDDSTCILGEVMPAE